MTHVEKLSLSFQTRVNFLLFFFFFFTFYIRDSFIFVFIKVSSNGILIDFFFHDRRLKVFFFQIFVRNEKLLLVRNDL